MPSTDLAVEPWHLANCPPNTDTWTDEDEGRAAGHPASMPADYQPQDLVDALVRDSLEVKDPCWQLVYPTGGEPVDTGDCVPHFATENDARAEAPRYAVPQLGGVPVPEQLDQPCVVFGCACGDTPDDCVSHYGDPGEAKDAAVAAGWVRSGDQWRCSVDCTEAEVPTRG